MSTPPRALTGADAYRGPSTTLANRLARALWALAHLLLVRFSPRPAHAWRAAVLRLFGARLGPGCHVYPRARIWAPWLLVCEDGVGIADEAIVYNPAGAYLGSHCVVSQQAYLCGASHDLDVPEFPMLARPIRIGARAWICARACVGPGVSVGEGAVLGLGAVTVRDLEAWTVYAGNRARVVRARQRRSA